MCLSKYKELLVCDYNSLFNKSNMRAYVCINLNSRFGEQDLYCFKSRPLLELFYNC
uniref:Uncharacterized protein n=1 Tax=Arundo donax TaxID=35708 RepID=A0A0A9DP84_ARUDO